MAAPVLQEWGRQVDSLWAVTPEDVQAAVAARVGSRAHRLHTALRSLFRALKRERRVFRDPTRKVSEPAVRTLPRPLPADRLHGLVDKVSGGLAKLAVALVAVHALRPVELRRLRLADLDRAAGRLTVRRAGGDRVVVLDEFTLRLSDNWLRERARRWPACTIPHLLVSQQAAVRPDHPPLARFTVAMLFAATGVTPEQVRVDRILDAAATPPTPCT